MKTLLAREICTSLSNCDCPTTQMHNVFNDKFLNSSLLQNKDGLYGGALSIIYNPESRCGELLWAHTSKVLCLAYKSTKQKHSKFISSTLPENFAGKKVCVSGLPFVL